MNLQPDCFSCRSNTGEQRISPAPTLYAGQYWLVEHAYPTRLAGWLVAVLKRHCEALHELTPDEWRELAEIQAALLPLLAEATGCEKEYTACFAEMPGFKHIHFHIIPKPAELPAELTGSHAFALLKVDPSEAVPAATVRELCQRLSQGLQARLSAQFQVGRFEKLLPVTRPDPSVQPPPACPGG